MSRSAHSRSTSPPPRAPEAHQPAFPYIQGVSVATNPAFQAPAIFSTGLQHPYQTILDLNGQPQFLNDFDQDLSFNRLDLSGPEAASLLSFQPPFSYVSPFSLGPDISGLLTAPLPPDNDFPSSPEFPSSPVFPGLLENTHAKAEPRSLGGRRPQTPSPSFRSRRRISSNHAAAQQHSPPSPSYAASPCFTSPTESTAAHLTSAPPSSYLPIAPRPDEPKIPTTSAATAADDPSVVSPTKKRKKLSPTPSSSSGSPTGPTACSPDQITAEDALLVRLREEERIPWKDVAARFLAETGQDFSVAALQMRLKRLRERVRVWTENDLCALRMAHEYWISHKFEIIAAKMTEFGLTETWSASQCARKLHQMGFPTSPIMDKADATA